jgi:hypothetical protein
MIKRFGVMSLVFVALFSVFILTEGQVNALQITVTDAIAADRGTFNGGAFWFTPDSGPAFKTFCLERNETLVFNKTYSATIDSGAIKGGLSGGNPDLLDIKTDYLYNAFALNSSAYNANQMKALQLAIWKLEGEILAPGYGAYANPLDSLYVGTEILALAAGYYNTIVPTDYVAVCKVVNLYDAVTLDDNQSGIIRVPEANTLILLGCALVMFPIVRRRMGL